MDDDRHILVHAELQEAACHVLIIWSADPETTKLAYLKLPACDMDQAFRGTEQSLLLTYAAVYSLCSTQVQQYQQYNIQALPLGHKLPVHG